MSQERLKHHRSPNGGLPTGVRDEVPGEAEGRSAESARADILCRQDDARCGRSSRCAFHLQAPTKGMAKRGRVAEVARLVSRPELVKLSHRTALPRHRTLKATLDWSYDLPPDAERIVFRRIAPFVGHFTLEARGMPQGELDAGAGDIFDAIAGLIEQSLTANSNR